MRHIYDDFFSGRWGWMSIAGPAGLEQGTLDAPARLLIILRRISHNTLGGLRRSKIYQAKYAPTSAWLMNARSGLMCLVSWRHVHRRYYKRVHL